MQARIDAMKAREAQLKEYEEVSARVEARMATEIAAVDEVLHQVWGHRLTPYFTRRTLRVFLNNLPPSEVVDAMATACARMPDATQSVRYFCGICWRTIKAAEMTTADPQPQITETDDDELIRGCVLGDEDPQ